MFFSAITQNLNWKIVTENLVTFKRWDGVKNKKFEITEKSVFFGGGGVVTKTQYMGGGELPKKGGGAWTISRFRGGLGKKDGVVFLRGGGKYDN